MEKSNHCPRCGAEVPSDAPQGLCPQCVLQAGLGTQSTGSFPSLDAEYVPPTPAELASCFPDLEILKLVGRGGMGVVYQARQKRLDRLVALKILAPKISHDPTFAERFAREARALAMLNHPHIVAVYDFGQTVASGQWPVASEEKGVDSGQWAVGSDSQNTSAIRHSPSAISNPQSPITNPSPAPRPLYYFLMEYVDGVNLRRLLDTGKLAPEAALAIVPQICEALQYAHDHGVVHRDIKPENVLLDKEGRVKIADFGIAKLVGRGDVVSEGKGVDSGQWAVDSDSQNTSAIHHSPSAISNSQSPIPNPSTLTAAGQIIGTPQYMAPEQIEHPLQVDHRADIYSLGVVFYQMLTGELPTGRIAPPSQKVQIDVRLDEVVLRAMEKEPERRYQQASEFKTQVESIATTPSSNGSSKTSLCYVSTPEHLRSFRGRFLYTYKGKGELRLDRETLSFHSDWPTVTIPLSSIRKIARGEYPLSAKPAPLHFIEVTFMENNVERSLLFTPVLREVMLPPEANQVVAEWIAALLDAVRTSTGRTLAVEPSQVVQDKFGLAKTVLLTVVQLTIICTMIPAILLHQMPGIGTVLSVAALGTFSTIATLLAIRWWYRRSAAPTGNFNSGTLRTSDAQAWQSPDAGWGWLIGKMFGITFLSRNAYRCANLSALGFLGFLGFMPYPEAQHFFGFFGLFGLIGVAHMIEAFARPNLTTGKMIAMLSAIAMAIGISVMILIAVFSAPTPRLQWQAETKLTGPGIDRVVVEGNQAIIEGEATTDSRIFFGAGQGYQSCGFVKNGRFTATVKTMFWRYDLGILVVDDDGNQLLTSYVNGLGELHFPPDRVVFGETPIKVESDGAMQIAEIQREDGQRLPLTVRIGSRPKP